MRDLRIYILNWNGGAATLECIDAVQRSEGVRPDLLVIDNGSTDGSAERLAERLGSERVLALPDNRGYAGGMNVALEHLRRSDVEYALLLTEDVVVAADAIARMADVMRSEPKAGIVGPVVVYRERPERVVGAGGLIHPGRVAAPLLRSVRQMEPYPVDWLDGCCLLVRRAVAESVGGFDEDYFIYYEETDFCHRVQRAGWSVLVAPRAEARHEKSGVPGRPYYYYMTRNRYRFWRKNFGLGALRVAASVAADTAGTFVAWCRSLLWRTHRAEREARRRRFLNQARGAIAGTAAHLRGRYGRMPGPEDKRQWLSARG